MMRRVISIWLPDWPVDLLRRRLRSRSDDGRTGPTGPAGPDAPIVLWASHGGAQTVAACCRRCRERGITVGMRMAHARALLTAAEANACVLARWRPKRDAAALRRLAEWALRYAPSVAVDGSAPETVVGGLLIDLAGCGRLHGESRDDALRLLRRIGHDLAQRGISARLAAAPTVGAAWALARYAPSAPTVVGEAELVTALDGLPIEALRLEPEASSALREVEITRIGDLRILPREAVARRHGGATLRRLDQALDDGAMSSPMSAVETIVAVREAPVHRVHQAFDGPVRDVEAIALATRATIDRLCALLESASCGVRRLSLMLERAGAEPWRSVVDLSRPTRRPTHLWALLRPHLETAHLGFGVEAIVLEALRIGTVPATQRSHFDAAEAAGAPGAAGAAGGTGGTGGNDDDASAGELLDALLARLGAERVLRPTAQEAHLPERRVALRSVLEASGRGAASASSRVLDETADDAPSEHAPPLLLAHPETVTVEAGAHPEAPPASLSWRGERLVIALASGPQRLLGPWWERADAAARDYWRLRDERGRWLWAYRDLGSGRWFVHGAWV